MASPTLVGTSLYLVSEKGITLMWEPGREGLKELGRAALGERVYATPAFLDGRIYMRGAKNLYCIESPAP